MRVLSIIDSFKGTLTSNELGMIATNVFRKKGLIANYIPISDGGDGFLEAIAKVVKTNQIHFNVLDPLGREIRTYYLYDEVNNTAYIELAKSSGINLLKENELNPFKTSTFGLGQVINNAIDKGIMNIIVGIGGSATNDGGAGMLAAMGCLFYDKNNHPITHLTGGNIDLIDYIDPTKLFSRIASINFTVLSDVTNPLLYENGASFVFARQKGAKDHEVRILDQKMENYSQVIEAYLQQEHRNSLGAGAAGGVGFAFHSLLKARFYTGIDYILDLVHFDELLNDYDYIITGEGKIDKQSLDGKVVFGISKRAKGKKIILVCAINEIDEVKLQQKNIWKIYAIVNGIVTKAESMKEPKLYFERLCETIEF